MTKILEWNDFQKENKAYLENRGIENPSVEEAFKLGQIAFIGQIAETLGVSLTYNGLDWIDEIGNKLRKERTDRELEERQYREFFHFNDHLISTPKDCDYFDTDDGRRIKI